jgi:hypothetical protein
MKGRRETSTVAEEDGGVSGEVERLEAWQLAAYLRHLEQTGTAQVTWNKEQIGLDEAKRRAGRISDTATVVADGATIYVAEPDHSPDEAPRISPIQIQPRRPS